MSCPAGHWAKTAITVNSLADGKLKSPHFQDGAKALYSNHEISFKTVNSTLG